MNPRRELAKLATADPGWEVVAGALAGLPRHIYLLGRYKWALDDDSYAELYYTTWVQVVRLFAEKGWNRGREWETVKRKGLTRAFAEVSLDEICTPLKCPPCNGSGNGFIRLSGGGVQVIVDGCPDCGGRGEIHRGQFWLMRHLDLDAGQWRAWSGRLKECVAMVSGWEHQLMRHLNAQLAGE